MGSGLYVDQMLTGYCGICWTNSWAPCEPGTPGGFPDENSINGIWMICQMCEANKDMRKLRAALEATHNTMFSFVKGPCEQGCDHSVCATLRTNRRLLNGE